MAAEILQGLTREVSRIEHYLFAMGTVGAQRLPNVPGSGGDFLSGWRRSKGVSLTTIDAPIAAIALEHRASVFTLDKDFSRIARLTGLALYFS